MKKVAHYLMSLYHILTRPNPREYFLSQKMFNTIENMEPQERDEFLRKLYDIKSP